MKKAKLVKSEIRWNDYWRRVALEKLADTKVLPKPKLTEGKKEEGK